jgi:hypothetical protein
MASKGALPSSTMNFQRLISNGGAAMASFAKSWRRE